MSKIRVAVFGASGYAGEELLRLLLRHNQAEIAAITSRKNAGEPVSTVFPRFTGLPLIVWQIISFSISKSSVSFPSKDKANA